MNCRKLICCCVDIKFMMYKYFRVYEKYSNILIFEKFRIFEGMIYSYVYILGYNVDKYLL